jgi:hypothetical protein
MGLFDFLKKKKSEVKEILGPTYLDHCADTIYSDDVLKHEWRGKIRSPSGQKKFRIKFYGKIHSELKDLIVGTDFAPILVYAVDPNDGQEILIFDGCKYGYNMLFCDTYTQEQFNNRPVNNFYKNTFGDEIFEIVISVYNVVYYDGELLEQADGDGFVELVDGSMQDFKIAQRNAFDTLQVYAINEKGESFNIIAEELA